MNTRFGTHHYEFELDVKDGGRELAYCEVGKYMSHRTVYLFHSQLVCPPHVMHDCTFSYLISCLFS